MILDFIDFTRVVETSTKFAETFTVPTDKPSLIIYRDFDEGKTVYDGNWEVEEIKKTMKELLVPMVYKVDHENINSYIFIILFYFNSVSADVKDGFLIHIFVTEKVYKDDYPEIKDELYEKVIMPRIESGSLKRGNFTIGITNGEKYKGWLKLFHLENNTLPSAAAYFPVYINIFILEN